MDATNIVEVVSEFVSLKKVGTNYRGLCPFHDDKTPSFYVSPTRGICHCFACGEGGNAVNFIMKHDQLTYPEALRWLANKYHIEIQERELSDAEKQQESERESMFLVNEWSSKYFQNILHHHVDGLAIGMQYFRSRGFRDDIINKFQLGFCLPDRNAFSGAALKAGYKKEFLTKTGLCYEREQTGDLVDRFSGRVIFPWMNISGKVVAFTGRVLDSRTKGVSQKYVNSPDSEIYHKSNELYGIYQAKKAIAKENRVFLVEGQADVISFHQSAIENVVAGSGTALTMPQIKLLRRFTQNVTLIYDGDEAGIHAAMRGTDMLLSEGLNVKVLMLPDGQDPDDFARSHEATYLRKYIEDNQTDFIVFKISQMLNGVTDPIKRTEAINSIVRSISVIRDPILRATYTRECATRTGIPEATLIASMNRMIHADREQQQKEEQRQQATAPTPAPLGPSTPVQQVSKVEDMLVRAIVRHGHETIVDDVEDESTGNHISLNVAQYICYDLQQDGLSFATPLYNQILEEAVAHSDEVDFNSEEYFTHHPDIGIQTVASHMCIDKFQLSKSLEVKRRENSLMEQVAHMLLDFHMDHTENALKQLKEELSRNVNDTEKVMQLLQQIKQLQEYRNKLAKELGSDILV
jgi:DNA primase